MRQTLLLLGVGMGIALGGCDLPCGGCADFESCNPGETHCALNAGATFDLIVTSGYVSTNGRTLTDGLPSPQICVTIGGPVCSTIQDITYYPTWNQTLFSGLDGAALIQTPIPMSYIDKGIFSDVTICDGTVTMLESYLHDGGFNFNCNNGSYVTFRLSNVDHGTDPVGDLKQTD
jgi:hypothetical protein